MDANNVSNVLVTQITSSAIAVWAIQKLKTARWFPFLEHGQKAIARVFSVAFAFFASIGISYTWNKAEGGGHILILAIPTFWVLVVGLWHWLNQFVLQETIYQSTVNKLSITTTPSGQTSAAKVTSDGQMVIPKTEGQAK